MRPAETQAVAAAINQPDFSESMKSMLLKYDDLPTVLGNDGVNFAKLGDRKQLMIDSFGLLELIIQTKRLFKSLNAVAVQATLFVCTSEGYQPVFSRLGYASAEDISEKTPHANVVGFAESNAEKRILQALGLPDVKFTEPSSLRSQFEANKIKIASFLKKEMMEMEELVMSFNSTKSHTAIKTKVLTSLSTLEASELVRFINEAG